MKNDGQTVILVCQLMFCGSKCGIYVEFAAYVEYTKNKQIVKQIQQKGKNAKRLKKHN